MLTEMSKILLNCRDFPYCDGKVVQVTAVLQLMYENEACRIDLLHLRRVEESTSRSMLQKLLVNDGDLSSKKLSDNSLDSICMKK